MSKSSWLIGSVSEATLKTEDLIDTFSYTLKQIMTTRNKEHRKLVKEAEAIEDFGSDDAHGILEELFDALESYALPYFYFGASEGDGASFGYWLSEDALRDAVYEKNVLKIDDWNEVPKDYRGEVLIVNDHGNMSLYYRNSKGNYREIWAIV